MPDILQDFPIKASAEQVFDAISTPGGLDQWWTKSSAGAAIPGAEYELGFGPDYQWRGRVTRVLPAKEFEWEITEADDDWRGTRVGFEVEPRPTGTFVRFHHTGWRSANDHYRASAHCWAMYLRILRRYLEHGEHVAYDCRLDA